MDRAITKKNTVLALLRRNGDEQLLTHQSLEYLTSGCSLRTVLKLVDIDEPELFVANTTVENLLVAFGWTEYFASEAIRVQYQVHPDLGLVLASQVTFTKDIPVELLVRVLNSPQSRLLWDSSLSDMQLVEGSPVLDAQLKVRGKTGPSKRATRYVREHRDTLVLMQFVNEPELKKEDCWVRHCAELHFAYVSQSGSTVEILHSQNWCGEGAVQPALKEFLQWNEKYVSEILYQMPR